ncbi:MAG: membrane protein insertase YidC [Clostridiales bacterium]|nr:membrane protein insertase YidC [Clostridiales bacterium]
MQFLSMLYTLIIAPLELLFEVIFEVADKIIGNAGLSIVFLSLAVNFLVLPLYKRADELQAEERDIQAVMAPHIKHIKKKFKGDERFFMLQEYYRLNNYKPLYALKSSVSLLLQIPFFIAAYNLLSHMQSLQGMRFGILSDLGKEDALFMIGNFPVNVLPILMTLINIISGIIYTKGHPLRSKIQVYGLAAVFLVLLYHSPSGLVFYWLLNNVFSLVKNIFYKLKDPKKVLSIVLAISGAVIFILAVIRPDLDLRQKLLLTIGCVLLALPLISSKIKLGLKHKTTTTKDAFTFFAGAAFMAAFTGLFIPSTVISDSAEEFLDVVLKSNPVNYIINSMLLSFGSWVLWGGVFYFFMSDKLKNIFCKAIWMICGISVIDYLLFGTNLGILTSTLQYEVTPVFRLTEYLINTAVVIAIGAAFYFIYSKLRKNTRYVLIIGILTVVGIGLLNCFLINSLCNTYKDQNLYMDGDSEDIPPITLSKDGNNVVIIMLDRALGTQVPYIFDEKPELKEQFDGFTYYPNTISYGACTNTGAPPIYGGYEYTPERMNARSEEALVDKHDEALEVMPVLFSNNGYSVSIYDPPYAGYKSIPDLSVFDDHPEFTCSNLNGHFNYFSEGSDDESSLKLSLRVSELRNRNFFCYSLMKISPLLLQETLYDDGYYNESVSISYDTQDAGSVSTLYQKMETISNGTGYSLDFVTAYAVLQKLPDLTEISEGSGNTFIMMSNDTAHAPCLLQEPDYTPALYIDNTEYDTDMISRYTVNGVTMNMTNAYQVSHYHSNMATYLKLGEWFDYLREQGVYDNTRIILVSDHGRNMGQFGVTCNETDMEYFMPLLMVKDFNSTGFTVCEDFMTNADTPALATSGIIDNPENPFTHNPIISDYKNGSQTIFLSSDFAVAHSTGNTFLPGSWFTFNGSDPYDPDNWSYLGDY